MGFDFTAKTVSRMSVRDEAIGSIAVESFNFRDPRLAVYPFDAGRLMAYLSMAEVQRIIGVMDWPADYLLRSLPVEDRAIGQVRIIVRAGLSPSCEIVMNEASEMVIGDYRGPAFYVLRIQELRAALACMRRMLTKQMPPVPVERRVPAGYGG